MKRICITAIIMLLCFNTITVNAADKKTLKAKVENMTEDQKEARYLEMKERVNEIKSMDKSSLTKNERKELRNELKDLNQEAKAMGRGGIYISTAALIIIILLLILILK
jgi:DNA gyrase/topoisomerase IV subunit A